MNLERLKEIKVNQVFKTYKDLCLQLDEPIKTGDTKHKQFLKWNAYIDIIRKNNTYVINEIFQEPKPIIDSDFVQIFLLRILLQSNETETKLNKEKLIQELNNIRNDYKLYEYYKYEGSQKIELFTDLYEKVSNIGYKNIYLCLKYILESAIKQLNNKILCRYTEYRQSMNNNYSHDAYGFICVRNFFIEEINNLSCEKRQLRKPSLGEQLIEKWLWNNNINYIFEYQFYDKEFKDINNKRFDYAIFINSDLICLIEYDGKQHEQPVEKFGGEEGFKRIQYNDSIKNWYCEQKGYKLIRIKEIPNLNKNNWKIFIELEKRILPLLNNKN